MSTRISYTSFDYEDVTIVPVIASFDTRGRICPLYVRIDGTSYKIDSYTFTSRYAHITEFTCRIIDGNSLKPLSLTYYTAEGMWTIPSRAPAPAR